MSDSDDDQKLKEQREEVAKFLQDIAEKITSGSGITIVLAVNVREENATILTCGHPEIIAELLTNLYERVGGLIEDDEDEDEEDSEMPFINGTKH